MGGDVKGRLLKSTLIAIIILAMQWVALPLLERYRPGLFQSYSQCIEAGDRQVALTLSKFGVRRAHIAFGGINAVLLTARWEFLMEAGPVRHEPILAWMTPPFELEAENFDCYVSAYGWPMAMFQSGMMQDRTSSVAVDAYLLKPNKLVRFGATDYRGTTLPIGPLWRGLTVNLAFWWLLAFGVLSIPLRVWLRRRKGRCPKCAYDLKRDFANGCSECGWRKDGQPTRDNSEGALAQNGS